MENPLLAKNNQPYNTVPFEDIKSEHFLPAIKETIDLAEANIKNICDNEEPATFDNTIIAFETAKEDLDYVNTVFHHLFASEADQGIRDLIKDINPLTTKLSNDIYLNEALFLRIKDVFDSKEAMGYNEEDLRLINEIYSSFARNGANLNDADKETYRSISQELSILSPKFSDNVLKASNKINKYWIDDENLLTGIPQSFIDAASELAKKEGREGSWCFSLDTNFGIIVKFCKDRSTRKDVLRLMGSKCNGDEFDNTDILRKISKLRHDKANLLGYDTHADYVLNRRMAQSKNNVYKLIDDLIVPSFDKSKKEFDDIKAYAKELDGIDEMQAWDTAYYGNLYKEKMFDFNDEALRPYFKSENVINGVFDVANKLYGITINHLSDVQVFHDEVNVYKVDDKEGNYLGLLYIDLYPRETKRNGAWMNQLRSQGLNNGEVQRPHVTLNCNLTKPTDSKPALWSINEVRTVFHEFGHCLHGLFSNVKYQSLGSMSVYWDFVELPSQILENWLTEPEVIEMYAKHYETGESMPMEYIDKINEVKTYMSGSNSLRQLQLCKIDMGWHDGYKQVNDVEEYEGSLIENYRQVPKVEGNSVSCSFGHIFSGGYSAGYYSYKWAELLEADAFEKFKNDGIFNVSTAESFKKNILSKGNMEHPMNLYVKFMGREPKVDALLRKGNLV